MLVSSMSWGWHSTLQVSTSQLQCFSHQLVRKGKTFRYRESSSEGSFSFPKVSGQDDQRGCCLGADQCVGIQLPIPLQRVFKRRLFFISEGLGPRRSAGLLSWCRPVRRHSTPDPATESLQEKALFHFRRSRAKTISGAVFSVPSGVSAFNSRFRNILL
jgi:hypothetical protein